MSRAVRNFGKKILGGFGRVCPKLNAKMLFLARTHKWPNLKNPQTFNEKTTWLKLNDYNGNELVSKCADKYAVREYVKSKGCDEILNELYGVYDDFDEIDFEKLPNQFVIKCTHGCAYNIIVDDKKEFDKNAARKKIKRWMREKYGYATSELHYTRIKPRIIVEKYLCDKNGKMPVDYKFYCMNGKVECVLVCSERDEKLRLSLYDKKWQRLPYVKQCWSPKNAIERPKNLNNMIKYAEKLSEGVPFVRVDLYNNGRIIFGELTFTPACSCNPVYNRKGDDELGKKFNFSNLGVQTLLSVAGDVDLNKLLKQMKIDGDYVVINQIKNGGDSDNKKIHRRVIKINDRGLSRSRNLAIKNCVSEIMLFSDDDMEYEPNYLEVITKAYKKYPDAAAIAFIVEHEDKKIEKKPFSEGRIRFIKSLRISSIQLTVNAKKILDNNIRFDEAFGAGSKFEMGEENIFLADIFRKHLKIYYVPEKIGTLKVNHPSSWFKGYNEKYFIDRGASFYRMSPKHWRILVLQFVLRKRNICNDGMGSFKAFKMMHGGAKKYKKEYRDV